jgi:hypothetical protein
MEYFYRSQNYILIGFIISTYFFIKTQQKLNKHFVFIALLFIVVEVFQFVYFGGFNLRTFLGTYIRLFLSFSVLCVVHSRFLYIYTSIIYFFSTVSLVFYVFTFIPGVNGFYTEVLGNLIPNFFSSDDAFYKSSKNIIIFNFHDYALTNFRNSGPFWEPGAFATFLLIALIFNHSFESELLTKKNIIFIIATITTLSTTGFICLFIFIFYINYNKLRKNILFIMFFILSIFGIITLYEKIPFLKDKIEKDIEYTNETTSSRFGSALADYTLFKESPLFGYGRAGAKNDFKGRKFFDVDDHRNNGVFNLLVTYGIFITIIYLYKILITFKNIGKFYNLPNYYFMFCFLIFILLAFSQGILMRPFFYGFLFLPMLFDKSLLKKNRFENRLYSNNI